MRLLEGARLLSGLVLSAALVGTASAGQSPSEEQKESVEETVKEAAAEAGEEVGESGATRQASRERPRTLAAARERQHRLSREKSGQVTGMRIARAGESSLAAYDAMLLSAVEQHWRDLLAEAPVMPQIGKLVLEFDLHCDGRVDGMKVTEGPEEALLGILCQRAVLGLVPFSPWPATNRRALGCDVSRVTITFYHYGGVSASARSSLRRMGAHLMCDLSYPPPVVPDLADSPSSSFWDRHFVGPWWYRWPYQGDLFDGSHWRNEFDRSGCEWPRKGFHQRNDWNPGPRVVPRRGAGVGRHFRGH